MLETRVIQIGRVPVRFAVTGQGEPLVLIHGLAGSWRWWRRNVPALREHRTIYLIDLPGFGAMRAYRSEFSLAEAPTWIRALLQALNLRRPSIVGHSMGGAIALAFAARWPEEVDRVVLAAPAVSLPGKTIAANLVPLLAAAGRMEPRFYPTLFWDTVRAGPVTLFRTARTLLTMDAAADIEQLRTPTLLIWGSHDDLVPLRVGQMLRGAIPSSRLQVIDRAGHVLMFDRPVAFNNAVLQFLSREDVGE